MRNIKKMYLQMMCCYWRSTNRQYIKINNVIRLYSYVPSKKKNNVPSQISKSTKFPEHELIYAFPYIGYFRMLNLLKRNTTILAGASIPISIALQASGFMSGQDTINLICFSLIITFWCHTVCYVCNNLIGSIYFKEDNQEVIISYLNYWGKRIDLKTHINHIVPLTETPLNIFYILYRNLNVISHKQKLKINIRYGRITEETRFANIVGDIL
nr:PREDICTED: transmembrane protein 186 isoform X2 [Megachile rotundata]